MICNILCSGSSLKTQLENQDNIKFINSNVNIFVNKLPFYGITKHIKLKDTDYLAFIDRIVFDYYLSKNWFEYDQKLTLISSTFTNRYIKQKYNRKYINKFISFEPKNNEIIQYKDDKYITCKVTSALLALSFALKKSFKTIVFWGLDMYEGNLINNHKYSDNFFKRSLDVFNDKRLLEIINKLDVKIYNMSKDSKVNNFIKINDIREIK
jgi:hypothetical protein